MGGKNAKPVRDGFCTFGGIFNRGIAIGCAIDDAVNK